MQDFLFCPTRTDFVLDRMLNLSPVLTMLINFGQDGWIFVSLFFCNFIGLLTWSIKIQMEKRKIEVSGKLPTYRSPNSTLAFVSYLGKNVGLGEGYVGSFLET